MPLLLNVTTCSCLNSCRAESLHFGNDKGLGFCGGSVIRGRDFLWDLGIGWEMSKVLVLPWLAYPASAAIMSFEQPVTSWGTRLSLEETQFCILHSFSIAMIWDYLHSWQDDWNFPHLGGFMNYSREDSLPLNWSSLIQSKAGNDTSCGENAMQTWNAQWCLYAIPSKTGTHSTLNTGPFNREAALYNTGPNPFFWSNSPLASSRKLFDSISLW